MDKKPKRLFDDEVKTPKKLFQEKIQDKDPKAILAEKLASIAPIPPKKPEKEPKSLFDDASSSNVEVIYSYIENNYPEILTDKDKIKRQIKQLFPLNIEIILSYGGNTAEISAQTTEEISKLSLEISNLNINERVKAVLDFINKKQGFFSGLMGIYGEPEFNLNNSKKELKTIKLSLNNLINNLDDLNKDISYNENRLKTNYITILGVREAYEIDDDVIKNAVFNRCILLQGAVQQIQLNKIKLQQVRQLIVDNIQKIDQLLTVTIPAHEASK